MPIVLHESLAVGLGASTSFTTAAARISTMVDGFLLVTIGIRSNTATVASVTNLRAGVVTGGTNDEALTFLGAKQHSSQQLRVEFWGKLNPGATALGTGGSKIQVTMSASAVFVTSYMFMNGVDQTTPYVGYPSTATNLASQEGNVIAGTTTGTLAVTTASGETVFDAICVDLPSTGSESVDANNSQTEYINLISGGSPVSAQCRLAVGTKAGAGSSVNCSWAFSAVNESYAEAAFSLKNSTRNIPYYVEPPQTELTAVTGANPSTLNVVSTTGFNATGALYDGFLYQGNAVNRKGQYTGLTATTFTGVTDITQTAPIGSRVTEIPVFGNSSAATLNVILQSNAAVNDIAIVNFLTADTATAVANASFTSIDSQTSSAGGFKQWLFYRRIQAGDLVNEASRTFTFTCGSAYRIASVTLYRNVLTTWTPTSSKNVGTNTPATNASVAVTANSLCAMFVAYNPANPSNRYVQAQQAGSIMFFQERGQFRNVFWSERMCTSAFTQGAINMQIVGANASTEWGVMAVVFTPGTGSTVWTATLTDSLTIADSLSRATSTYNRHPTETLTIADTVAKSGSLYHKALSRAGSIVETLVATGTLHRALTRVGTIAESLRKSGSTYHKSLAESRNISEIVQRVINSAAVITRALTRTGTISETLSRAGSTYRRHPTRTGTIAEVLSRAASILHKALTDTRAFSSAVLSRAGSTYRRHPTDAVPLSPGRNSVTFTVTSVGLSFFTFGPEPILRLFDSTMFSNCTFYFEATLRTSSAAGIGYARLFDVTAGAAVSGSQINTSAPHTTGQRVRSAAITLVSGHTYRAEQGRTTGYTVIMSAADLRIQAT